MELDYDVSKPKESAEKIYEEIMILPESIKKELQSLIKENPLIQKKNYYPETLNLRIPTNRIIDMSDLVDSED